jgi:hypothetical protein
MFRFESGEGYGSIVVEVFRCLSDVAVGTTHFALIDFSTDLDKWISSRNHLSYSHKLDPAYMIELKHDDICFAAIDTGMVP